MFRLVLTIVFFWVPFYVKYFKGTYAGIYTARPETQLKIPLVYRRCSLLPFLWSQDWSIPKNIEVVCSSTITHNIAIVYPTCSALIWFYFFK